MADETMRLRVADHDASDKRIALEVAGHPLDVVGWVDNDDVPEGFGDEWADRIARAVNTYEPMREALEAVRERIIEIGGTLPGGGTPYDRAMRMCAAIPVPIETLRKAMDALRAAESPEGTR